MAPGSSMTTSRLSARAFNGFHFRKSDNQGMAESDMVRRQQVKRGRIIPLQKIDLWCGATAGGYSASALLHSTFAYFGQFEAVAALIASFLPAIAQWLVLRRFFERHVSWLFLSAGALLFGPLLGELVARQGLRGKLFHHGPIWEALFFLSPSVDSLTVFLVAGLVVGASQALILRGYPRLVWMGAVTVGYVLAWVGEGLLFELLGSTLSFGLLGHTFSYTLSSAARGLVICLVSGVAVGFCLKSGKKVPTGRR